MGQRIGGSEDESLENDEMLDKRLTGILVSKRTLSEMKALRKLIDWDIKEGLDLRRRRLLSW